jgi:cyclin B
LISVTSTVVFHSGILAIDCSALIRVNILFEQEKWILNTLEFNMSVPTPYVFMRRFLKAADYDRKVKYCYLLITISVIGWQNSQQ